MAEVMPDALEKLMTFLDENPCAVCAVSRDVWDDLKSAAVALGIEISEGEVTIGGYQFKVCTFLEKGTMVAMKPINPFERAVKKHTFNGVGKNEPIRKFRTFLSSRRDV